MPRRFSLFVIALCITAFTSLAQEPAITPKHSRHFTRYEGCEFVPTKYADGDSFNVRIGADEFVLRLYYVDAPESDERFADRNAEQAKYFGITPAESVEAGKEAKEFVSGLLTGKKFVVFTRWATALGSSKLPRYYAIIEVDGRGLADLLVENGFTIGAGIPVPSDGRALVIDFLVNSVHAWRDTRRLSFRNLSISRSSNRSKGSRRRCLMSKRGTPGMASTSASAAFFALFAAAMAREISLTISLRRSLLSFCCLSSASATKFAARSNSCARMASRIPRTNMPKASAFTTSHRVIADPSMWLR